MKNGWFLDKWAYWISTLFLVVISYIGIAYTTINKWLLIVLLIISQVFSTIGTFKKEKEEERQEKKIDQIKESSEGVDKKIDIQTNLIKRIENSITEKKQENLNFLYDLIENGVITENDAQEHLPSENIYTLYCFPTHPEAIKKEGKKDFMMGARKYPQFLKDIGFIRMGGRSTYYITSEDRLNNDLRNVATLKKIILRGLNFKFKEEWEEYLNDLSKKSYLKEEYEKLKKLEYKEVLKASIIMMKGKLNPYNLDFINERTFNKEFYDLMNRKIELNKLNLSEQKKINVKRFLFDASIDIAFKGLRIDSKKLMVVEENMRKEMGIRSIIEYSNKTEEQLFIFFKKQFPEKSSLKYVKILQKRVKYYKEALKELKIMI